MPVRVQTDDFDVTRELALLRAGNPAVGAVAAFIGVVRDLNDSAEVRTLTLEHYVYTYLPAAIEAVRRHSGSPTVSLVGYCMGGIFSLLYAAGYHRSVTAETCQKQQAHHATENLIPQKVNSEL